ncbi:MAG: CRISPR-associated helicase Cas3' [Anaerolineae bacterium]|nr:CRISPR-associated helicase Cas3' [Anaerolineae bacterium]
MSEGLYPYQQEVRRALQAGKSVILRAPTGAGKTRAALHPFLERLRTGGDLPAKCLYSVPMRVLASQFVERYRDQIADDPALPPNQRGAMPRVAIQTGEQPDDPRLEATLTFATIDQVLSSFLLAPYGLSTRQANLNAAALLAAYLVFDEFHLFDPSNTLPTTLGMLKMLRGCTPFLLMTATFSTNMLQRLAEWLCAEVIDVKDSAAQLPSQAKTRAYYTQGAPLTPETILKRHTGRTLVVCNTVERAQALYKAVRAQAPSGVDVLLLHARFLSADRNAIESRIRHAFARGNTVGSYITIATQAIEVGLDITCSVLHTELAPANAVIQRSGRCARYADEHGEVFIYRYAVQDGEVIDLVERNMPYNDQRDVIERTWDAFSAQQGRYDYAAELDALTAAHAEQDERIVARLTASEVAHLDKMRKTMHDGEHVSELIRDQYQQRLLIHSAPEQLLSACTSPYALEGFNLHFGVLESYAQEWFNVALPEEPPFRLKMLGTPDFSEELGCLEYIWERANSAKDLAAAPIIVVHPDLASYDPELGLQPRQGSTWQTAPAAPRPPDLDDAEFGSYRLETYAEHIQRVYQQFADLVWAEMAEAAARLERQFGWQAGILRKAAQLVVLLHDVGKLNVRWQEYVQAWQKYIGAPADPAQVYAHTDMTEAHAEQRRAFKRKAPPHAVEGALLSAFILRDQLSVEPIVCAAFSAIARHHSARADSAKVSRFELRRDALQVTRQSFAQLAPELTNVPIRFLSSQEMKRFANSVSDLLVNPTKSQHEEAQFAYILLARVLRRADQRGTRLNAPVSQRGLS